MYFPGGLGTYDIGANDFLAFESGPTESFTLQWATYKDAADQCALSRIWGGIHPPMDDIRGRVVGSQVAERAIAAFEEKSEQAHPDMPTARLELAICCSCFLSLVTFVKTDNAGRSRGARP